MGVRATKRNGTAYPECLSMEGRHDDGGNSVGSLASAGRHIARQKTCLMLELFFNGPNGIRRRDAVNRMDADGCLPIRGRAISR
jgi:hypothetical protein